MLHRLCIPGAVLIALILAACEPLMYNPTPVAIVITGVPSPTPLPSATPTPAITRTPIPTETPDVTPSPTPFPCENDTGEVIDITDNRSTIADGENLRYRVYVPPCYWETQRRFPVLVLLHGLSYREQQWEDIGLIDALNQGIRLGALAPMIVVMPYLGQLGQINSFPPDPSYEGFILEELLPQVDRDFCTIRNRDFRAIGGISRGGFLAYSVAMRHPDLFSAVGGHSAYFPNIPAEIPSAFNPLELALNASFLRDADLRMYLDNGVSDSSGPSQQLLSARLTQRGIPHDYQVAAVGEHNNDYWSTHVEEYLRFYAEEWSRSYETLPGCADPSP